MPTAELADRLGVTNSTVRNLLAHAYVRLNVNNRAAIAKAQQLSLITGPIPLMRPEDLQGQSDSAGQPKI